MEQLVRLPPSKLATRVQFPADSKFERRPRGGMDRASVCNFRNATVVGSNPVQDARIFHPKNTTIRPI